MAIGSLAPPSHGYSQPSVSNAIWHPADACGRTINNMNNCSIRTDNSSPLGWRDCRMRCLIIPAKANLGFCAHKPCNGTPITANSFDGTPITANSSNGTPITANSSDGTPITANSSDGTPITANSSDGTPITANSSNGTPIKPWGTFLILISGHVQCSVMGP
jgi:hypothetical protein